MLRMDHAPYNARHRVLRTELTTVLSHSSDVSQLVKLFVIYSRGSDRTYHVALVVLWDGVPAVGTGFLHFSDVLQIGTASLVKRTAVGVAEPCRIIYDGDVLRHLLGAEEGRTGLLLAWGQLPRDVTRVEG